MKSKTPRTFKFSGRIEPGSLRHATKEEAADGALIPPTYVQTPWGSVPQYAPTVYGAVDGFNPAGDCGGYYMSYQYQPNNNCYAYACCIAPNSFPQPGRASGGTPFSQQFTAQVVATNAQGDGLQMVGTTLDELKQHAAARGDANGHYVALMFSPPESNIGGDPNANWPGDYHWARCDDPAQFQSWSQKDGGDQVTNFDFAGYPITSPATANWTVNQGPIGSGDNNEYIAVYTFYCYMFVPPSGVNII